MPKQYEAEGDFSAVISVFQDEVLKSIQITKGLLH